MRLLLCDDQVLSRARVREMLKEASSIQVIGEASGGRSAVKMALELSPDVILMDICMPDLDGIEATRQILARAPDIRIVAFSSDFSSQCIGKMFSAGARGYLLKPSSAEELLLALRKIHAGEVFLSAPACETRTWPRPD
jgi:DNA-binding NarL/FixJ family response regulator